MKAIEFIKNKITVGSFPYFKNKNFDASKYNIVINVSDEFYPEIEENIIRQGLKSYWFPMGECKRDIGLNSIYGAMITLYNAEKQNKKVYLHCHAGVNRSMIVYSAYYYMRTGMQLEKETNDFSNRMLAACGRGYLPPKKEMEGFLNDLRGVLTYLDKSYWNLYGGALDQIKVDNINNF